MTRRVMDVDVFLLGRDLRAADVLLLGVFFVVRSVIRRYRLDLRPANRPVAGVLLVLLVFPLGYGRAILERRRLSDVRLRLS